MKLRTSFFEPTVFKKDITRFWPLWGLYGLFSVLILLLTSGNSYTYSYMIRKINDGMGTVNFVYALLVAVFLFGDLFKSRMCNALHALPLRREGWFFTHVTAGLLFSIVPNTVTGLLAYFMFPDQFTATFFGLPWRRCSTFSSLVWQPLPATAAATFWVLPQFTASLIFWR